MKPLYIIGSGGFSKQVIEIVEKINEINKQYKLVGIIDDDTKLIGNNVLGYKIIGDTDYLKYISDDQDVCAVIAIGNGKAREKIYNKLTKIRWVNLIHPQATISKYMSMGEGNIICGGVTINPECKIGNHCNINIGSTLGHDVCLKDFTTIMPGCNISGNVNIKRCSTLGTGSCVIQNIKIEENSMVGAGAVVLKNVDKNSLYVGIPAKKVKNLL